MDLAIGIDLGTTNSCMAIYINGRIKILENVDDVRITPSFVFFTTLQQPIVGEHGKHMASYKPENGIYGIKRFVGRKFHDAYIQSNLDYLPYKLVADVANNPLVEIKEGSTTFRKTPQELCTIILQKLRKDVEAKLGETVTKVVITVPAYFNVTQREVTLAAAKDAGFTVLKLLNEPTAAALCYYFDNDSDETNFSLVYDLGGGTFDVAVLKRKLNDIEIVSVDGDTQLGGQDFDNLIASYVCDKLIRDYGYDPKSDRVNLRRLHNKCEVAKRALSAAPQTTITLIGFVPNQNSVKVTLTREQFEAITNDLFKKSMDIVDNCVKNSGISKCSIKEVILSGGSTRIPKIQKMISDYFEGKTLNKFVNPDECVAEGAALQAAMLSRNTKQSIQRINLVDVIPLSLGSADFVDKMTFIIKKNSRIPASETSQHTTVKHRQASICFRIVEGERLNAKKNRFLGEMVIEGITPAPPGQCYVSLTLNVDENGILTAKAVEEYRENVKELKINYTRGDKSEAEIKNALLDADQNKEEDERFARFAKLKGYLLRYCYRVMYNLNNKNLTDTFKGIYELCEATRKTADVTDLGEEEEVKQMIEEIKIKCEPTVKYYNFDLMPTLDVD